MTDDARHWVWTRSRTTGNARLVLLAIADKVPDTACVTRISTDDLCSQLNASLPEVQSAVSSAIKSGELVEIEPATAALPAKYWMPLAANYQQPSPRDRPVPRKREGSMGYQLRRDLRLALGPDIKGLQRAVALEIADDANDNTRESLVTVEVLAQWTAAGSTDVIRTMLKRLSAAGWEFRVPIGKGKDGRLIFAVPGVRTTFRVPEFTVEGVTVVPPKEEPTFPHGVTVVPPRGAEGGTTVPSEGTVVPSQGTHVPPFPSPPHSPHVDTKDSPGAEQHLEAFGAFWLTYPKKKAREEAKRAWIAAINRGAKPEHIVKAAQAYARERAQQDPKFTKYPATWLNKGCYDDEPDPVPSGLPQLRSINGTNGQTLTGTDAKVAGWFAISQQLAQGDPA